jgi:hypothetical protein
MTQRLGRPHRFSTDSGTEAQSRLPCLNTRRTWRTVSDLSWSVIIFVIVLYFLAELKPDKVGTLLQLEIQAGTSNVDINMGRESAFHAVGFIYCLIN